jgi:hypothetical protein
MSPDTYLSGAQRFGLLVFLWCVLGILTWLVIGKVLPHFLEWPAFIGWPLIAFMATAFVSLYLGAFKMSARVLSGSYPGDVLPRHG